MDVIDACADLLPCHLLVKKTVHHTTTRLVTLPNSHPLAKHVGRSSSKYVKRHREATHNVMHMFNIRLANHEDINPTQLGPKWGLCFPIQIPMARAKAVAE